LPNSFDKLRVIAAFCMLRSPAIFAPPKSEKYLERAEKPTEMLASQARKNSAQNFG